MCDRHLNDWRNEAVPMSGDRVLAAAKLTLPQQRNGKTLVAWARRTRAELRDIGFRFRSKEEIDQQLREEREAWGD